MKTVLFLANGHGEDRVAAEIIKLLPGDLDLKKLSLVKEKLPSGGFSLRNLKFLLRDLAAGLLGNTFENYQTLKALRGKVDLTIAIGDIVPITGALIVGAPFIFVGVNKSDYYHWFGYSYTPWEKWLLKKFAKKIYARDQFTANNLKQQGIVAEYAGNPLMDCLGEMKNEKLKIENEGNIIIGLLPGTREDTRLNVEDFERVIEELLTLKDPDTKFQFQIATNLTEIPEYMEKKSFAEVLGHSNLIIGLSGTGNEQAAGCGLPVVSFYGRGAQYNKKFAQAQKQLLGDALLLIKSRDPKLIALHIWRLLKSPDRMKAMGKVGKERLGEGGAVEKISRQIISQLK